MHRRILVLKPKSLNITAVILKESLTATAGGKHPFPFRTRKLSRSAILQVLRYSRGNTRTLSGTYIQHRHKFPPELQQICAPLSLKAKILTASSIRRIYVWASLLKNLFPGQKMLYKHFFAELKNVSKLVIRNSQIKFGRVGGR